MCFKEGESQCDAVVVALFLNDVLVLFDRRKFKMSYISRLEDLVCKLG